MSFLASSQASVTNPESTLLWAGKKTQATRLSSVVLLVAQSENARKADDAKWAWCSVRDMHKFSGAQTFLEKSRDVTPMSEDMKAVVKENLHIFTPWMRFGGKWVRLNLTAVQALHVLVIDKTRFDVVCDLSGRVRKAFRVQDMTCTDFIESCLKANGAGVNLLGPYSHDNFTENRFEKWSVLINAQCIETINCLKEDVVIPGHVFRMNIWMKNGRQLDGLVVTYQGDHAQSISSAQLIRHMMLDQTTDRGQVADITPRWKAHSTKASDRRARNAARAKPY
jgi:hypothetical protein